MKQLVFSLLLVVWLSHSPPSLPRVVVGAFPQASTTADAAGGNRFCQQRAAGAWTCRRRRAGRDTGTNINSRVPTRLYGTYASSLDDDDDDDSVLDEDQAWRRSIQHTSFWGEPRMSSSSSSSTSRTPWWKKRRYLFFGPRRFEQEEQGECDNGTSTSDGMSSLSTLKFDGEYDQILLGDTWNSTRSSSSSCTAIVLIHPIGVGISKWFYNRLVKELVRQTTTTTSTTSQTQEASKVAVIVPDLLGSGSACRATELIATADDAQEMERPVQGLALPLLNISAWSDQIVYLMGETQDRLERNHQTTVDTWCIVANGGCSPIALQAAAATTISESSSSRSRTRAPSVTQVILSSVPRLPFFLEASDPTKVAKSYKTLCGLPGRLFWWYATRSNGAFIRKFSERNLVADPANLGKRWQANCFVEATRDGGASRYSTFAFLAGTLQDGCRASLDRIVEYCCRNSKNAMRIDFIKGRDVRRNQAKSWFWQKKQKENQQQTPEEEQDESNDMLEEEEKGHKTIRDYIQENGIGGGREALINGRISLAHEDAVGYASALLSFLSEE